MGGTSHWNRSLTKKAIDDSSDVQLALLNIRETLYATGYKCISDAVAISSSIQNIAFDIVRDAETSD